jgi:hypothetical protein
MSKTRSRTKRTLFGSSRNIPAVLANPPISEVIDIFINEGTPYTGTLPYNAVPAYWIYQRRLKRSCPYPLEQDEVTKYSELFASLFHSVEITAVEAWGNSPTHAKPSLQFGLQCVAVNTAIARAPPSERLDASSNASDAPYACQRLNPTQHFWTVGTDPSTSGEGDLPNAGILFTQFTRMRIHATFR